MIQVTREQHACPPEIERRITRAGGVNPYGEPNFRVVWGASRLSWIGGEWVDWADRDGTVLLRRRVEHRFVPKYLELNFWHVEKWCAAEEYGSPLLWRIQTLEFYGNRSIEALGPYPSRGEYELSHTLSAPCAKCTSLRMPDDCTHREFVQITPTIAETIARMILLGREKSNLERRQALEQKRALSERAREAAIDEIMGADPKPVSPERLEYIDRVIVPQLDQALARAKKKTQGQRPRATRYPVTAMRPKPLGPHAA